MCAMQFEQKRELISAKTKYVTCLCCSLLVVLNEQARMCVTEVSNTFRANYHLFVGKSQTTMAMAGLRTAEVNNNETTLKLPFLLLLTYR